MSPAIVAPPEGPEDVLLETTEAVKASILIDGPILTEGKETIPPALLASLFLILGVVVFLAVMMKRLLSQPEMMQRTGRLKSCIFVYGSINLPLDELYKAEQMKFLRGAGTAKTRPTKFVSVSEMWKEKQSKNHYEINKIPEEPEEDVTNKLI